MSTCPVHIILMIWMGQKSHNERHDIGSQMYTDVHSIFLEGLLPCILIRLDPLEGIGCPLEVDIRCPHRTADLSS